MKRGKTERRRKQEAEMKEEGRGEEKRRKGWMKGTGEVKQEKEK